MSQPPSPYVKLFSFETFSIANPTQPLPGVQVDNELNLIAQSLSATISRLNELQRADGKLKSDALDNTEIINTAKIAAYQATMAMLADTIESLQDSAVSTAQVAEDASDSAAASAVSASESASSASLALTLKNAAQLYANAAEVAYQSANTASSLSIAAKVAAESAAQTAQSSSDVATGTLSEALLIKTYLDSEYFEVMQKWRNLDDVENKHQAREHLGVQGDVNHAALYHEFKTTLRYYRPPQVDAEIDDADQLLRKWFGLDFNVTTDQFDKAPDSTVVIFDEGLGPFNWDTTSGPEDWNSRYPNVTSDMTVSQRVDILRARLRSFGVVLTNSMLFLRNEMQGAVKWATSRKQEGSNGLPTNTDWAGVYEGSFRSYDWQGAGPNGIIVSPTYNRFLTFEDFAQANEAIPSDGVVMPYVSDYVTSKISSVVNGILSQDIIDGLNMANPAINYFNPVATYATIVDTVRPLIREKIPAAINWTGAYSESTTYNVGDGVSYNGEWYVARDVLDPLGGDYAPITGQPDTNPSLWTKLIPSGVGGGGSGGDYLPLAGGTMTGNIAWSPGGQYIGVGADDFGIGGYGGLSTVCSVGYDLNWQAGWLTAFEQDRTTRRPLYLNSAYGSPLRSWDYWNNSGVEVSHTGVTFPDTSLQITAFKTDWTGSYQFNDIAAGSLSGYTYISAGGVQYPDLTSQTTAFPPAGGTTAQYIDGTGALQTMPTSSAPTKLQTTVYNSTGSTIPKHSVVYINGGHGNDPTIALAKADAELTSRTTFGFTTADIPTSSLGTVTQVGLLENCSTNGYADGTPIFLSPTVAGGWTTTQPYGPYHYVCLGTIVRAHPTQGTIQVRIINSNELNELSDIYFPSAPNDGDILQFKNESPAVAWRAKSPADAGLLTEYAAQLAYYPLTNPSSYVNAAGALAAVPDSSTSVKGKVQLATSAEVLAGTNTTKAVTPDAFDQTNRTAIVWDATPLSSTVSATSGAGAAANISGFNKQCTAPTSVAGYARITFPCYGHTQGSSWNRSFDFSKKFIADIVFCRTQSVTDTNSYGWIVVGDGATVANNGDPNDQSFGIKVLGSNLYGFVHNGTTLSLSTSPILSSFTSGTIFTSAIISDGAGNVSFYINGSLVTTMTGGPTSLVATNFRNGFGVKTINSTTLVANGALSINITKFRLQIK